MTKVNPYEEKLGKILASIFPNQEVVREHRFDNRAEDKEASPSIPRKWRFDFAYPNLKIAIEVEGGTWSGGRHVNPIGFSKDCEKYNEATRQGWKIFRLVPSLIDKDYISDLLLQQE